MANAFGKYSWIDDPQTLKLFKPKRKLLWASPDLANFSSDNEELLTLGNFGMEMMKFLPKFEQLIYKGGIAANEGEADAVKVFYAKSAGAKPDNFYVLKKDFVDAFNQYSIEIFGAEAASGGVLVKRDGKAVDFISLNDIDGDGNLTNELNRFFSSPNLKKGDVNKNTSSDYWRQVTNNQQSWLWGTDFNSHSYNNRYIFGQHHRTGKFLSDLDESGFNVGGAGMGGAYKNLNFDGVAGRWNHIWQPKKKGEIDFSSWSENQTAKQLGERDYFLFNNGGYGNYLGLNDIGFTWSDINNLLYRFGNRSFYNIVIDGAYKNLTNREFAMLIAAMYESRERAWACLSTAIGPVQQTRNDRAIIGNINDFLSRQDVYKDYWSLGVFQYFLEMNHSVINQMTMFYQRSRDDGYNYSVLDSHCFAEFNALAGREYYNDLNKANRSYLTKEENKDDNYRYFSALDIDMDGTLAERGKLYGYRQELEDSKQGKSEAEKAQIDKQIKALEKLINAWFGATEPSVDNPRPTYSGYSDWMKNDRFGDRYALGDCETTKLDVSSYGLTYWEGGATHRINYVYKVTGGYTPVYSWDSKTGLTSLYIETTAGERKYIGQQLPVFAQLHNLMYGASNRYSHNLELPSAASAAITHPDYVQAQFYKLTPNTIFHSAEFKNNWAVFAFGSYKKMEYKGLFKIIERNMARRANNRDYNDQSESYREKEAELFYEEKLKQKAEQKRKAEQKKLQEQGKNHQVGQKRQKDKAAQRKQDASIFNRALMEKKLKEAEGKSLSDKQKQDFIKKMGQKIRQASLAKKDAARKLL